MEGNMDHRVDLGGTNISRIKTESVDLKNQDRECWSRESRPSESVDLGDKGRKWISWKTQYWFERKVALSLTSRRGDIDFKKRCIGFSHKQKCSYRFFPSYLPPQICRVFTWVKSILFTWKHTKNQHPGCFLCNDLGICCWFSKLFFKDLKRCQLRLN